jgi:hypothetical protein
MSAADIYTFITVNYKHGEYSVETYHTLRAGLQVFLEEYTAGGERQDSLHQQLEALPDEKLLTEVLNLG